MTCFFFFKIFQEGDAASSFWYVSIVNSFVPNSEEKVRNYIKSWGINGFILSGGDDLGVTISRDNTENIILEYAIKNNFPLLGICRGLQLIVKFMGGSISKGGCEFVKRHVSNKHEIMYKNVKRKVNSYHSFKIDNLNFPDRLRVLATDSTDGSIEAVYGEKILGLMWHPERKKHISDWEKELITDHFNFWWGKFVF